MKLTAKGEYGMRAVLYLARLDSDRPVSVKCIAREEGVSPAFLEQIFFRLRKSGLVRSFMGPHGGFALSRSRKSITVKDVLDALGEPIYPVPCAAQGHGRCKRERVCDLAPVWRDFHTTMRDHLEGVVLDDVVRHRRKPWKR
jgi:Rrf2 family iron-sulfur cluster assembly transcriptional regulator